MAGGEIKRLAFSEGTSVDPPSFVTIPIAGLEVYANTAAYVTAKGSAAAAGDIYYDSTDLVVKYYTSAWISVLNAGTQSIAGIKTFSTSIKFANSDGGTQAAIDHNQEYAVTHVFKKGAGSVTASPEVRIYRMGHLAICEIQGLLIAEAVAGYMQNTVAIPSYLRPTQVVNVALKVSDNGTAQAALGICSISTSGIFTMQLDGAAAQFTSGAGNAGTGEPFSMVWTVA